MKLENIYELITKAYLSDKGLSRKYERMRCFWYEEDGNYIFTLDGKTAYCISKKIFPFNINELGLKSDTFPSVINKTKENDVRGYYKYTVPGAGKQKLAKIEGELGEYAWVDEKWVKMFDTTCEYRLTTLKSETSPVAVYEFGRFVGVIMPVRHIEVNKAEK